MSSKRSSSAAGKEKSGSSAAEKAAAAKAKEEANRAKEELVKAMTDPQKTDLLAQALLREYMHRKGFKHTLASFDKENPRTETTINSRELMNTLLTMRFIQERNSQREDPLATIMEVLCSYRLRKRTLRRDRGAEDGTAEKATNPYDLVGPTGASFDSSDEEGELRRMAIDHKQSISDRRLQNAAAEAAHNSAVAEAAAAASSGSGKKPKKDKADKKEKGDSSEGKKKDKKAGKKDKDRISSLSADAPAAPSRVKAFDPLGFGAKSSGGSFSSSKTLASSNHSAFDLPQSGHGASAAGVGSKWMPGGNSSAAPTIGVAKDSSGLFSFAKRSSNDDDDDGDSYKPPSFVAGDGFKLSTDTNGKVSSANAADVWGGNLASNNNSGSNKFGVSPNRANSGEREDIPSPYANLGGVKYDSHAKAKSVLSGGSTGTSSGGGVGFNLGGSTSSTGGGSNRNGRRITWGGGDASAASASTPMMLSEGNSPNGSSNGPTRVGFGFNTSGPGSPNNGRARRSVTILGE